MSDSSSTRGKVVKILADNTGLDVEEIKDEQTLCEDIGLDDLDMVEVVMDLEEEYGVELEDENVEKLNTVADLVAFIDAL